MKTEPTLIPPAGAAPTTSVTSLERALAKCQEEAVAAFTGANGERHEHDSYGGDSTDKYFNRAIALMNMTAKLGEVMAKLNSHRSQTHLVHRTEVRTLQPSLEARMPAAEDDPEPPYKFYDAQGNRRPLTAAEAARYNAWSSRHAERERLRILAEEAEQGTPTPNSSGSNAENGPRVRY